MARCQVYEIQGPDPSRTAAAVRCHRPSVAEISLDDRSFRICKHHQAKRWERFVTGGWLYAVDLASAPITPKSAKGKHKGNGRGNS